MVAQVKEIRKQLREKLPLRPVIPDEDFLSLGSTLMNLAVSGRADGGIAKSHYLWYVGDSSSGKTWFATTLLAEACLNPNFDKYRLIYDDVEHGRLMDVRQYFGDRLFQRLEPPGGTRSKPKNSLYVRDFYYNLWEAMEEKTPFIYVVDSMDSLDTKKDETKFLAEKVATEAGESTAGSYGMAKAKENSDNIKRFISRLARNGSILVVINQTRDNIKTAPWQHGPAKRAGSGGHALRFYAHVQLWTSIAGVLTRQILGKKREYGKNIRIEVEKNRVSGWEGSVMVPFLRKTGIDDTGSCVDYLCEEGRWKRSKSGIIIADLGAFKFSGRREELIEAIEGKESRLKNLNHATQFLWRKIDDKVTVKRRKRYL